MRRLVSCARIEHRFPLTRRIGSFLRRPPIVPLGVGHVSTLADGAHNVIAPHKCVDVLIVTALEEEHTALVAALGCVARLDTTGRRIATTEIAGLRIAVECLHGMGNVGAASAATSLMVAWRADYLILVGITGGFGSADVRPGDVVIPDQVVGYESSKLTADGALRRPEVSAPWNWPNG
jgi:hypothetical protein